jgi:hypothetical protein
MRRLTHEEKVIEKIALLLLTLEPNRYDPERTLSIACNTAESMAYRAKKAMNGDPSWWEIVGKPDWNARMNRIKVRLGIK